MPVQANANITDLMLLKKGLAYFTNQHTNIYCISKYKYKTRREKIIIEKTRLFIHTAKMSEYLGINLVKKVKVIY